MSESKKTIKLNYCGCGNELRPNNNPIHNILKKHFNIEVSAKPDYVICGIGGNHFEYMKYDCIRIMLMTENLSPDFTLFDYCIGFDYIDFGDRYFRLPYSLYDKQGIPWIPEKLSEEQACAILKSKKYFCNFIYRHPSAHGVRERIFDEISKYKRITSAGNYRNNIHGVSQDFSNQGGRMLIEKEEKLDYLKKSKFTIASESVVYPGFETEKLIDVFKTHSIPIYYGSDTIRNTFNDKSFINVDEDNLDNMVNQIVEHDNNDKKYIEMLMECPLKDEFFTKNLYNNFEEFLLNIFSVTPQKAWRRPRYYYVNSVEVSLKQMYEEKIKRKNGFRSKIKKTIKKITK